MVTDGQISQSAKLCGFRDGRARLSRERICAFATPRLGARPLRAVAGWLRSPLASPVSNRTTGAGETKPPTSPKAQVCCGQSCAAMRSLP
jgi:hypothetical protein